MKNYVKKLLTWILNDHIPLKILFTIRCIMMKKPMGPKYFFSLYWRNVKGTFTKPYAFAGHMDKPGGVIIMGHTALLPVTLTLGAMTKTLIDFFTRNC